MDITLIAFFLSVAVVMVSCVVIAIVGQYRKKKKSKDQIVSGAHNHVMETTRYSGKYSVCKKIGEANAEF